MVGMADNVYYMTRVAHYALKKAWEANFKVNIWNHQNGTYLV